jgi:dihydroneopterin aldolase
MDRIEIKNMQFYGYHGVFKEEKKLGQRFHIDVVIEASLRKAGCSDDLNDSINYSSIYEDVREIVTGPPCDLLESVGEKIAMTLLRKYSLLLKVHITVKKPEAPIAGILDYVAVHIERDREDLSL